MLCEPTNHRFRAGLPGKLSIGLNCFSSLLLKLLKKCYLLHLKFSDYFHDVQLFFIIDIFNIFVMEIMALQILLRQFRLMILVYEGKLNWPT